MIKNFLATLFGLLLGLFLFAIGLATVAVLVIYPKLPELNDVQNYQPKEPLTIYSSDGVIIGTYGDERRSFTPIDQFPELLKNAVIAAEDKRFREHFGVDIMGIARAALSNLSGGHKQGASTITQQVARNFYLSNERTLTRKFNEALLAYKIERTLTKDQILELYFNQIYLGQRAYGFAAAAKIYFNKDVGDLTLAEATILAGLPKAPSAFNPIINPDRARLRQEYILNNMVELGMITPVERQAALNEALIYGGYRLNIDQNSLYVAEMARQFVFEKYGEEAYTRGLKVYTTVTTNNQKVATNALRKALLDMDKYKPYRGAEQQLDLSNIDSSDWETEANQFLSNMYTVNNMVPAVVLDIKKNELIVYKQGGMDNGKISIHISKFVRGAINNDKMGDRAIKIGSVIRIIKYKNTWLITQQPEIQGALVSLDAQTGAIRALVGGYDFHHKAFNRATQSLRQPGSTFKPFIYSAALSKGYTASTPVNDAPISIGNWSPKNSSGNYSGFISLRTALTWSKNTVSVRITQAMGIDYVRRYVQRFGFNENQIPNSYTIALGTGSVTPLQMAEGYAVFANGGYKIVSYVIDKITNKNDQIIAVMSPYEAGKTAKQVIKSSNAYVMTSMLQDVASVGTAAAASAKLNRHDLAGKTGTTNDFKDAWFVGYNPKIVTAVYIGYDTPRKIGDKAFGGKLALPIWIEYMRFALKDQPATGFVKPKDIVTKNKEVYLREQQETAANLLPDEEEMQAASAAIKLRRKTPSREQQNTFDDDNNAPNVTDTVPLQEND